MSASPHPDELLPWHANGTLSAGERDAVDAHLRGCARCRGELAFLQELRRRVQSQAPSVAPDEIGLKRLLRIARSASPVPPGRWLRVALAASIVVIVIQAGFLAALWKSESPIEPLGGPAPEGAVLQVRFESSASEAHIRALLQQHDATLIDGPGALGVYRIRLNGIEPRDRAGVAKALDALRASAGIVSQAEVER